ncbi:hypothetical protein B0H19DRAFT_281232 [Mycena capillaripes]|nr:hypothetical protein B0H19DRAFT_281232 [Mycena capillaripes]
MKLPFTYFLIASLTLAVKASAVLSPDSGVNLCVAKCESNADCLALGCLNHTCSGEGSNPLKPMVTSHSSLNLKID